MKVLKITNYNDIENIKNYLGNDFIVDLQDCSVPVRIRVIDFLSGLLYSNGKLEKINRDQFAVKGI